MGGHNTFCHFRLGGGAFLPSQGILVFGNRYAQISREAKTASTILVEEPKEYATVLKDIRAGRFGPKTIAVFDRSPSPENVLNKLDNKIQKVRLLFNVPENLAEAKAIHGDDLEPELNSYMPTFNQVSQELTRLGGTKIHSTSTESASAWLDRYLEDVGEDELVLIVSHVERERIALKNPDGNFVPYPDGILPLVDSSSYAISKTANHKPLVWTVGCDTWDTLSEGIPGLSISRPIEYRESIDIVKAILESKDTVRSVVRNLQNKQYSSLPFNPPKKPKSKHFGQERPQIPLQMVVEVVPGNNLLTAELTEVA
jgi:hypothetical protein